MKHTLINITPQLAKDYLTNNVKNRPIKPSIVLAYANEMMRGRWQLTPQCISFMEDGTLADGQHRLHAIVKANVTIPMYVARGLDEDAVACIDIGSKRGTSDYLSLYRGIKNPTAVAAGVRAIVLICDGFQNPRVSPLLSSEIADMFIEELQEAITICRAYQPINKAWVHGVVAFAMKTHRQQISQFAQTMVKNQSGINGHPALEFIRWLGNSGKNYDRQNYKRPCAEVLFNCMHDYVLGKSNVRAKRSEKGMKYFTTSQYAIVKKIKDEIDNQF